MLLETLESARDYAHIYIAPHLDDAVLSCGGQIARHVEEGARVLVVTLCAASPSREKPLTPYAAHLDRSYGLGDDPTAGRREEDRRALAVLGCDGIHLDQLDAPYRLAAYGERTAVFAEPVPDDPLLPATTAVLEQLAASQPAATFYVPLGVGSHVDHLVVYAAGVAHYNQGASVLWYEDAPYAVAPDLVEQRLRTLDQQYTPRVILIGKVLERKLAAIREYRSQLPKLFRERPMDEVMIAYASAVAEHGHGERLWARPR
jgi:LmbE family N-acetylglucosaminyl deacetylase